jgi:hypothetical protein
MLENTLATWPDLRKLPQRSVCIPEIDIGLVHLKISCPGIFLHSTHHGVATQYSKISVRYFAKSKEAHGLKGKYVFRTNTYEFSEVYINTLKVIIAPYMAIEI